MIILRVQKYKKYFIYLLVLGYFFKNSKFRITIKQISKLLSPIE